MASAGVGAEGAGAAEPAPPHPAAPAAAEAAPASSGEDAGGPASSPPDAAAAAGQPIDYSALYEQVKGRPCHVERLGQRQEGFNGGRFRTKPDVIERELAPIQRATTLEEVHAALDTAGRNLAQLGAFSAINFLVLEEPEDDPEACSVEVRLEEKNWFKLHAATYLQGGENTFELGAGLHNASGRCEHVTANVEYGMEASHTAQVSYEQPRPAGLPVVLDGRVAQFFRNNQKSSSFTEQLRGVALGVKSMGGVHALRYELGWRSLLDPSRQASKAVLAQVGDYLKSSLTYTLTLDRRASPLGPLAGAGGWALRSTSEACGLGPDARLRYARQQFDAAASVPLDPSGAVAFTIAASAGLMVPWDMQGVSLIRPTCIADRFFLGGPSTLRGFGYKGIGPTDARRQPQAVAGQQRPLGEEAPLPKRDALGGDAFASVFASLMFQLPHPALQALKVHGHAWVNGGNVMQLAGTGRGVGELARDFGSSWRWSCGFGAVLPTVFGRFEANYCVILSAQDTDRLKRGLQLGFAASSFL